MKIEKNTGKAELCFVKVPEGSKSASVANNVINDGCSTLITRDKHESATWIKLPEGDWQIIGNPFEIDKDQCKAILKDKDGYHLTVELPEPNNRAAYFNARVAMDDWLKYLQIYQTNPYGEEPKDIPDLGLFTQSIRKKWQEWKKVEERVGNWILLIKTK